MTETRNTAGMTEIVTERAMFTHQGVMVESRIYRVRDGIRRVVWCLHPFDSMVVDGKANRLVYADFHEGDPTGVIYTMALTQVRDQFDDLHGLKNTEEPSTLYARVNPGEFSAGLKNDWGGWRDILPDPDAVVNDE